MVKHRYNAVMKAVMKVNNTEWGAYFYKSLEGKTFSEVLEHITKMDVVSSLIGLTNIILPFLKEETRLEHIQKLNKLLIEYCEGNIPYTALLENKEEWIDELHDYFMRLNVLDYVFVKEGFHEGKLIVATEKNIHESCDRFWGNSK